MHWFICIRLEYAELWPPWDPSQMIRLPQGVKF